MRRWHACARMLAAALLLLLAAVPTSAYFCSDEVCYPVTSELGENSTPMVHDHRPHAGELEVQRRRGTPRALGQMMSSFVSPGLPMEHAMFFSDLLYFAISTTDSTGRPWATLLVGGVSRSKPAPVTARSHNLLHVRTALSRSDPFGKCIVDRANGSGGAQLWAGLGMDFTDRWRVKVAGKILRASLTFQSAGDEVGLLEMILETNESMGNCPKYITERLLVPFERTPVLVDACDREQPQGFEDSDVSAVGLSQDAVRLIERSSTVYIATRHLTGRESDSDVGLNARGGSPGFVRVEIDAKTGLGTHVVVPDFSGNRFYQSLGNIATDPFAGLMVPCFKTGDVLYITGTAKLLFDDEARAVMPRVSFLLQLEITAHALIKGALKMRLVGEERMSPYNPPVRYLASEVAAAKSGNTVGGSAEIVASLVDVEYQTADIASFTFELSSSVSFFPGNFAVFDFSAHFEHSYQHMNSANPKALNDDHVRTWTISSSPPARTDSGANAIQAFGSTNRITCTIKRVEGGDVSSFLHEFARQKRELGRLAPLQVSLLGVGGSFSCFSDGSRGDPLPSPSPAVPPQTSVVSIGGGVTLPGRMLWIAGGVGITPFMAFAAGIQAAQLQQKHQQEHEASRSSGVVSSNESAGAASVDVAVLFGARGDETSLAKTQFGGLSFVSSVAVFDSSSSSRAPSRAAAAGDQASDTSGKHVEAEVSPPQQHSLHHRRMQKSDVASVSELRSRVAFICGPAVFMSAARSWLEELGVPGEQIHSESFAF